VVCFHNVSQLFIPIDLAAKFVNSEDTILAARWGELRRSEAEELAASLYLGKLTWI